MKVVESQVRQSIDTINHMTGVAGFSLRNRSTGDFLLRIDGDALERAITKGVQAIHKQVIYNGWEEPFVMESFARAFCKEINEAMKEPTQ